MVPVVALVLILAVVGGAGFAVFRVVGFLQQVAHVGNPVQLVQQEVEPPAGSIAWKLRHGQRVNILALGYGGAENDAPYLTDSIMVVSIDPASQRMLQASIPRDLWVHIDAWPTDRGLRDKINAAFAVPKTTNLYAPGPMKPAYQGRDGSGHLAEATVGQITGLVFDKYVAVDFSAFRQVVDALGGVQVHMDGPLDDCHYPDYHDGYMNHGVPPGYRCPPGAGIHFPAGDYPVNGEQALELARSRDAVEPEQASDFGRSRRQQMIVAAIKKKATSVSALTKAPQLMDALQANFLTDMDLTDIKALYDFVSKLPETATEHFAVTDQDLAAGFNPFQRGTCGEPDLYVLCPVDPTYRMWQAVFARAFVSRQVLAEQAPVQLLNASVSVQGMEGKVTNVLRPLGLQLADGVRRSATPTSVVYDYSGGRYPQTAAWLADFFGAAVQPATPPTAAVRASPLPAPGQQTQGLVVVMGSDFARRWIGTA